MVLLLDRSETRGELGVDRGLAALASAFAETVTNPTANGLRRRHYAYDERGVSRTRANVFSALSAERGYAGVRARLDDVDPGRLVQAGVIEDEDDLDRPPTMEGRAPKGAYLLFDVDRTELVGIQYERSADEPLPSERFANAGTNRTALTTTLGVRALAHGTATRLGFLGSGRFAPAHVAALSRALSLEAVDVYSPTREHREAFADRADEQLDPTVRAVDGPQAAVEPADVVVCCTNSTDPVFDGDWLAPGTTVACLVAMERHVGQQGERFTATEVDDTTVERADCIACNSIDQAKLDEQGVLWERERRGLVDWDEVIELGALVSGDAGREDPSDIALFHNNGGQGIADLAVAIEHHELAKARGLGTELPLSSR